MVSWSTDDFGDTFLTGYRVLLNFWSLLARVIGNGTNSSSRFLTSVRGSVRRDGVRVTRGAGPKRLASHVRLS